MHFNSVLGIQVKGHQRDTICSHKIFTNVQKIYGLKKVRARGAGDTSSIPGLGRSSGEGNGNPLQYSCLENPKGRGVWRYHKS